MKTEIITKNKNSLFVIIFTLIIVFLNNQLLIGQEIKNSSSSSSSVKKFKNNEFGFEFNYPSNLKLQDINETDDFQASHPKLKLNKIMELNLNKGFSVYTCTVKTFFELNNVKNQKELDSMLRSKLLNDIKFYAEEQEEAAMGGQRSEIYNYTTIRNNYCYIFIEEIDYRIYDFATEGGDMPRSLTENEEASLENWISNQKNYFETILSSIKFSQIKKLPENMRN